MIISGPSARSSSRPVLSRFDAIIPRLTQGEEIEHRDGKHRSDAQGGHRRLHLVDEKAQDLCSNADRSGAWPARREDAQRRQPLRSVVIRRHCCTHVNQALRAHCPLPTRQVEYIVKDGDVVIVDEFTGRSDGWPPLESDGPPPGRGGKRKA